MLISWHLSHCRLYIYKSDSHPSLRTCKGQGVCLFQHCVSSNCFKGLVQSAQEIWLLDRLISWLNGSFTYSQSSTRGRGEWLQISSLSSLANLTARVPWLWGLYLLQGFNCSRETPETVTCSICHFAEASNDRVHLEASEQEKVIFRSEWT